MTSRTHDAFGFAALITAAVILRPENLNLATLIGAVIAADIGASIPDMDTAGNRLWEFLPQGNVLAKGLSNLFYKHRTLTHSLIGVYGLYRLFDWLLPKFLNPAYIDPNIILLSLLIGVGSHLLADSLTEEGVPLLFPINLNFGLPPVKKLRIKTGRWFEKLIVYPGILVYAFYLIKLNDQMFLNLVRAAIR